MAAPAQAVLGGDWRADIAGFARRLVDAGLTPGIAFSVAVDDWVVHADGFGVADVGTGRRVTADTPFYIASSTKSLTATAAAIAAHNGDLDLGAPMVRYLPDARLADGVPREQITVHDLAALTHGLSGNGPVVFRTAYTGDFTREQLLDLLRHHESTGKHGTFSYDNLGFNLLGMVLESVYDTSWKEVVHRLVLEPLGMGATTASFSAIPPGRVAIPHRGVPEGWERLPLGKADANLHAAGGHFASARDLARYVAAHLSGGVLEGERVLPEAPLALTHRHHATQDRRFGPFHRHGWGYGWDLGTWRGDTLIHRFGAFAGYRSHMSFMPARGVGVVVLVNGDGPASAAADLLATYAYDRLLGKEELDAQYIARLDTVTSQLARYRQGLASHLAERRARLAPLPFPLEHYAGSYESPVAGRMEWRVVAGGLEVRMGVVHSRAEVFDASANQLRIEVGGSGETVTFGFPAAGGPAGTVEMDGFTFTRVASARGVWRRPLDAGVQVLNIQHVMVPPPHPASGIMDQPAPSELSRRERQVMDIVYRRGRATAADVLDDLPDPPSYSAVRAALRLLDEKGLLRHEADGKRYVYLPTTPRREARSTALRHVVRTFFGGSAEQVVNALLEDGRTSAAELARVARLIEEARAKEERAA